MLLSLGNKFCYLKKWIITNWNKNYYCKFNEHKYQIRHTNIELNKIDKQNQILDYVTYSK